MTLPEPRHVDELTPHQAGRLLRRHGWLILLLAVIGAIAGGLFALAQPSEYESHITVAVSRPPFRDPLSMSVDVMRLPRARTIASLAKTPAVTRPLLDRLQHGEDPAASRPHTPATVGELRRRLYANVMGDELIQLEATARTPEAAHRLATHWADLTVAQATEAFGVAKQYLEPLDTMVADARAQWLEATARLIDFEQAHDLDNLTAEQALEHATRDAERHAAHRRWLTLWEDRVTLQELTRPEYQLIRVVGQATLPTRPVSPNPPLTVGLTALAGALLGLAVALIRGPGPP